MGDPQPKTANVGTGRPQPGSSKSESNARSEAILQFLTAVCALKGFDLAERVDSTMLDVWEQALSDLSPVLIRQAMNHLVRTMESGTYWPTPGDVRKLIREAGSVEAEKAWKQVIRRIEKHHYDPDAGGWMWEWTSSPERMRAWEASGGRAMSDDWGRGWHLLPPELDAEAGYAVAIVGGWDRIRAQHGGREHDFVRRGFLEAFLRAKQNPALISGDEKASISAGNSPPRLGEMVRGE